MPDSTNRIQQLIIPAKTKLLFRRVGQKERERLREAIAIACRGTSGVDYALLLQCKLPSDEDYRLVTVLGVSPGYELKNIAGEVIRKIVDLSEDQPPLDLLPMSSSAVPPIVYTLGEWLFNRSEPA